MNSAIYINITFTYISHLIVVVTCYFQKLSEVFGFFITNLVFVRCFCPLPFEAHCSALEHYFDVIDPPYDVILLSAMGTSVAYVSNSMLRTIEID